MAEVIAEGRFPNGATWKVEGVGPWLDLLPSGNKVGARNNVMRWSLVEMGYVWASKFLGRRFTNYVRGAPFFYDMGVNAGVRKFRRMGLLQTILAKEMYGWDPWSNAGPPPQLIADYRRMHPEVRGGFSRTGNYFTLSKTIRRNSKRIVRDFVDDLLTTKIRPLVETGQAEATAIAGHRVEASATATRSRVSITVPFGGPRNVLVGEIVRTMPPSEVAFMAQELGQIIAKRLARTGVGEPGPMPVERGAVDAGTRIKAA